MAARITWNAAEGRLVLHTPYLPAFVEELKVCVPSGSRRWNPEAKTWSVPLGMVGPAVVLLMRHFGEAQVAEDLPPAVAAVVGEVLEGYMAEVQREMEERSMADKSKAPIVYAWGFPSRKAGPSATSYEVILRGDGTLSCNCPGWVYNKARNCAHVRDVKSLQEYEPTTVGGQTVTAAVLKVVAILDTPGRWGGSEWMGAPEARPKQAGLAAKAPTQVVRRRILGD